MRLILSRAGLYFLAFAALILTSCTFDRILDSAPKPGLVGDPAYSVATDHPSEHQVVFDSNASEWDIRAAFAAYCAQLGLSPSAKPSVIKEETWFESAHQGLGIVVSDDKSLRHVTVYRRF